MMCTAHGFKRVLLLVCEDTAECETTACATVVTARHAGL